MTKKLSTQAPGQQWMTITDLAKLAGVSVSTVSRALADNPLIAKQTREKIQRIAHSTGFSVNPNASSLRSKQSKIVSVIIALVHEKNQPLHDPFWMTMLAHLAEALTDAGYEMLLTKMAVHQDGWIERIRKVQRPAGIIVVGQSREHDSIERAAQSGCPIVVWGAKLDRQSYPTVGTDNFGGGRIAARHLIGLGYRRIAFLGDITLPEIAQRYQGYRSALAEAGIAVDELLVVPSGFHPAHAFEAAVSLIAGPARFDAIMASSDVIAISAIRALNAAGRAVPDDVGVVGFDDIAMAAFNNPPLTTVRQDFSEGARLLVQNMASVIAGQAVASIEMPSLLIERQSTRRVA